MSWRQGLLLLVAVVALVVPLPPMVPPWAQLVRVGLAVTVILCTLGKFLYDTLFYNGFRR